METHLCTQRPSVATVNLDHLAHNLQKISRHSNAPQVMAVVKANAYGHGLIPVAEVLLEQGVDQLAVALLEEGVALREAGIECPILVLGGIYNKQIKHFLDYDLALTVSSIEKLKQIEDVASNVGIQAKIHLKVDTGMERVGVHLRSISTLIETALGARACKIEGIYSHLACADQAGHPFTALQIERFEEACSYFEKLKAPVPTRHLANSGGVLYYPESHFDMVRPGILLFGASPSSRPQTLVATKPVLSLTSRVVYFKVVLPHHTVGYGGTWRSQQMNRIVTVPLGYGDGYPQMLSNQGFVLIHGKRYPIVGSVCMDQFMVNIGWDSAYHGDEVCLIGQQGGESITVEEISRTTGMISYEILTRINERIPREYIR